MGKRITGLCKKQAVVTVFIQTHGADFCYVSHVLRVSQGFAFGVELPCHVVTLRTPRHSAIGIAAATDSLPSRESAAQAVLVGPR